MSASLRTGVRHQANATFETLDVRAANACRRRPTIAARSNPRPGARVQRIDEQDVAD